VNKAATATAIGVAAALAVAALSLSPRPASAQNPAPETAPHRPAAKPTPTSKIKPPPTAPSAFDQHQPPTPNANGVEPDLAFGAFQRGFFLTAFAMATRRAQDKNDMKSMTLLGELYANGYGVPRDDAKAADWYKLAADRGDPNAMFALAIFRLTGRAGPRDREASAKWLAAAAKLGHPTAAYDLALLYMEGQLFPRDFGKDMREAARLWGLAALAENSDAEVEYAIALYNGDGVAKNEPAAAALFRKAAIKGSAIAQDRLARILAVGRGVPADPVNATKWHLISKARGETDLPLDDFVNNLDAEKRAEGEKAAKVWLDALKKPPA
jgi:hypothetical protein